MCVRREREREREGEGERDIETQRYRECVFRVAGVKNEVSFGSVSVFLLFSAHFFFLLA